MCLAMCLIFQQSEPSVLINRVLTEKKCVSSLVFSPSCVILRVAPGAHGAHGKAQKYTHGESKREYVPSNCRRLEEGNEEKGPKPR